MSEYVATHEYQAAADALEALPSVEATDVFGAGEHPQLDRGCIEVVVSPGERVPPRVLATIREHDLGLRPDLGGCIGQPAHFVIVVT
jgi:hypothetical protein